MFPDPERKPEADEVIRESERRQIQKELFLLEDQKEAAEKRFRIMFENALVGLFRLDVRDQRLTDVNQETARIFGFDSAVSLIPFVNAHPEKFGFFDTIPKPNDLSIGNPYSFSSRSERLDGSEFWAQFSMRYTGEGRIIEGAVKDITDQVEAIDRLRRAKAEAEEANEAKSRFLATISHEIRTPLNGIIGFAEILLAGDGGNYRDYSSKILDESDRLMFLINQLLDLSKLEASKISLESILFDLPQLLEEIESTHRGKLGQKKLRYTCRFGDGIPRWYIGDPMRLRQVLSNLISNAVKFTDQGGISLAVEQGHRVENRINLKFSVQDTGIGIAKDKVNSIFASFEQADTSISRKYGGTGLGVSICRELLALMGGELKVHSVQNVGSTFYFTIPMTVAPETMDGVPAHRGSRLSSISLLRNARVLLVEDYEPNREIAQHHLSGAGCIVVNVEHGRAALELIESGEEFDLIFMDVHMPEMDGLETTERLRAMGLEVPIIGMTASVYAEDRVRCLEAGMDDFLSKPLRRVDLLSKAVNWMRSASSASHDAEVDEITNQKDLIPETSDLAARYNEFVEELGGETRLAVELIQGFVDDANSRLDSAEKALVKQDWQSLHREAHSIKGGALNLMADELAESSLALEKAAKTDAPDVERLQGLIKDIKDAFGRFNRAWMQLREKNETDER
ncbi:MAG: ATP-binding protein [Spirochaetaceae bacterium]|nr:ATP-binding protein [Spirochaetaceae bacterium]